MKWCPRCFSSWISLKWEDMSTTQRHAAGPRLSTQLPKQRTLPVIILGRAFGPDFVVEISLRSRYFSAENMKLCRLRAWLF